MPIEVIDADGTTIEFPDNTDNATITSVMRGRDQERQARQRYGDPRQPGTVAGNIAGRAIPSRQAVRQGREQSLARFGQRLASLPLGGPGTFDALSALGDPARRRA